MDDTTSPLRGACASRHASTVTRWRPALRRGRHCGPRPLRRALTFPCLVLLGFGVTTGLGDALAQLGVAPVQVITARESDHSPERATGQRLLEKHDCWSGEAPDEQEGMVPAGAVVVPAGSDTPVHGAAWVEPALEHVFEGKRPDLTVLGFCAR